MTPLSSEIAIDAPKSLVRPLLDDLDSHPDWNPVEIEAKGQAVVGAAFEHTGNVGSFSSFRWSKVAPTGALAPPERSPATTPSRPSRLERIQDRAWQSEAGEEALVAEPRHR